MVDSQSPRGALPNFRTPRLLGIVNLLFASQILVCGLFMAAYVISLPLWAGAMKNLTEQVKQQAESKKQAEIAAIDASIAAATTDEEKATLADRRKAVDERPAAGIPGMVDFNKMGFDDPTVIGWTWAEVVSGLILNVMMMVSGVGLMNWKRWGWSLGVWTAWLKILRLIVVYALFIVLVVPPMSKALGDMVGEMMAQQQVGVGKAGGAPSADMFTKIYSVSYSAMGVGMILGGVIYPTILLWLLSKPGVKMACSPTYLPPKEPKQPDRLE